MSEFFASFLKVVEDFGIVGAELVGLQEQIETGTRPCRDLEELAREGMATPADPRGPCAHALTAPGQRWCRAISASRRASRAMPKGLGRRRSQGSAARRRSTPSG